jgi:hypothetical protein
MASARHPAARFATTVVVLALLVLIGYFGLAAIPAAKRPTLIQPHPSPHAVHRVEPK